MEDCQTVHINVIRIEEEQGQTVHGEGAEKINDQDVGASQHGSITESQGKANLKKYCFAPLRFW